MKNSGYVAGVAGNKRRRTKKILLWTLLVVQVCLIFCFWCMQFGYTEHTVNENNGQVNNKLVDDTAGTIEKLKVTPFYKATAAIKSRVNFVTKTKGNIRNNHKKDFGHKKSNIFENTSNFTRDFVEVETYRLMNITGIEAEMINDYKMETLPQVWCFRYGTYNDSNGFRIYWNADGQQVQCQCKQYWHGLDCSQNEVIYRALLLPRNQFTLRQPAKEKDAHLLVYMLESYFTSFDFLELQIKPITQIVDHFFIYWRNSQKQSSDSALRRKLDSLLQTTSYTLYQCDIQTKCSQTDALLHFRAQLKSKLGKRLQATDLLLHTNENALISMDVLRFFKYFAPAELAPWRFRLKHNVYGFFWQHPHKTYLNGFLSSLSQLDDPIRLTKLLNNNNIHDGLRIIGDLNHYSGWYCQHCAHPDEIIASLEKIPENVLPTVFSTDKKLQNNLMLLPKNSRNNLVIDAKYLEYLIAQGLHIDGTTHLQKVRWNSDAYYAPAYAEKLKWKFGNLLTNLFEALENDYVLGEAEGGFGF